MTQSVNGMNRSMRTLVNDALARRQAAEDLKLLHVNKHSVKLNLHVEKRN